MFYYLKGMLVEIKPDYVVLDTGGVGFQVFIPPSLYQELSALGTEITLYTHLYLREDGAALYGFSHPEVRHLFTLILGVAGFGPRAALNLIGTLTPVDLINAIVAEDHEILTRVPGVGTKTARRLVLELKEKVKALGPLMPGSKSLPAGEGETDYQEAMSALLVLGYNPREVRTALKAIAAPDDHLEDLVRKALRHLGES